MYRKAQKCVSIGEIPSLIGEALCPSSNIDSNDSRERVTIYG